MSSIAFNDAKRIFTIQTKNTTYQMMADSHDRLLHLYYGRKTAGDMDWLLSFRDRGFSGNPYDAGNDRTYSLDTLPQEFPTYGTGDFRSPSLVVETAGGKAGCDLRFESFEIREGKYGLNGLPAVYAGEDPAHVNFGTSRGDHESCAQTLSIILSDAKACIRVELLYGVLPELDIITRAARISNTGSETLYIDRALTANLDFTSGNFDLITFYGRHAMERSFQRQPLPHGEMCIGSRRGASSHQYNPLMILAEKNATETAGTCYAMEFVYSGGFLACAGLDQMNQPRMQMGLSDHLLRYPLKAGAVFTLPEVIETCSVSGLTGLSQNLQDCIRSHVIRGYWRDRIRPVLLNSWEGCYFTFNAEKILGLAAQTKDLGLDLLVLDDGWFGKRENDLSGLGDWTVNEKKIGSLHELVSKIHDMDLLFGIWFEPEMVSEDSDLFRHHPDWALALPGRDPVRSRCQLVLDFSRKDVVNGIYEQVCHVIDMGPVDYVKWDYNRSIHEVWSNAGKETGAVLYDYILGLYDFLERLYRRYPRLLIEGCSGGGGRFDAGMLYYTPQIWCSDNTDAVDRLRIQYGTSFGYPPYSMGAHVSISPNEQNGRVTSLKSRTTVAMSGTFGYELDPGKLSPEEKSQIRADVQLQKKYAQLILSGSYYRLTSPYSDSAAAWAFVSRDGSEALLSAVTLENHGNMPPVYIRLQGLDPDALYQVDEIVRTGKGNLGYRKGTECMAKIDCKTYSECMADTRCKADNECMADTRCKADNECMADRECLADPGSPECSLLCGGGALMQCGLPLPSAPGEYIAYQWHITRV